MRKILILVALLLTSLGLCQNDLVFIEAFDKNLRDYTIARTDDGLAIEGFNYNTTSSALRDAIAHITCANQPFPGQTITFKLEAAMAEPVVMTRTAENLLRATREVRRSDELRFYIEEIDYPDYCQTLALEDEELMHIITSKNYSVYDRMAAHPYNGSTYQFDEFGSSFKSYQDGELIYEQTCRFEDLAGRFSVRCDSHTY